MKINGKKVSGANETYIIIPRAMGEDIVFKAKAVSDMVPFETMCPPPEPPKKMLPGGKTVPNLNDKAYLMSVSAHSAKRLAWMVLTSLQATEGLEWETVDLSDHTTWNNFQSELTNDGFSNVEINRIVGECIIVNSLNEDKIEEARTRFLLTVQEQPEE